MKLDKSFCFMFLAVFFAIAVRKTNFFSEKDNQSNFSIKFCATNLRTRVKRKQTIMHCKYCSRLKEFKVS